MGALFDHPAVLNHHDDVGCLHGGQAVSNDDARPTLPGVIQSLLDNLHTGNTTVLLAPEKASLVLGAMFDLSLSYPLNTCLTDVQVSAVHTGDFTQTALSEPEKQGWDMEEQLLGHPSQVRTQIQYLPSNTSERKTAEECQINVEFYT